MLVGYPQYETRLRESAKRVVKTKLKLGLYENPVPGEEFELLVGNDEDKAVALDLARESIVLLKNNESVLPLAKEASVFLTGHSADNVGHQCGGWSIAWQGYSGNEMFPNGVSVRQGFEDLVGNNSFAYFNGLYENGTYSEADLAKAVELASQHEYTIAVIGEKQYTEKPGDIDDLALPAGQIEYVEALAATGTKVIIVLFEGRPRLLGSLPDTASAIIDGLLPCELGGQAMAEIIYGDVNPSGYTEFNYSAVSLDTTTITSADATVTATVTVTNVGTRAGKETVMLFLTQPYRTISVPEVKMLKKFKKIELQPGESQDVSFVLTADDWSVYDPQIGSGFKKITEDSNYVVAIKPDTWCNVYKNITNPLCAVFTIDTGRDNFGLPPPVANITGMDAPVLEGPVSIPTTIEPPADEAGAGTVEAGNY
ncbi:hypothetical protein JG687_00001881 [Phytophthora cactorum]|uniref:beta-glucosidase n=1 Tax=Phytophthora cactorum TaxID=29920 RepID=A0A8T1UZV5_9STRA|nr:hypothetical protein JG687_00001881 [Phytophthora cactorum]